MMPVRIDDVVFRLKARDLWQESCAFCSQRGFLIDDILGFSRHQEIVRVRHAYWAWLADHHHLALSSIGRLLGRDHTTVMYGIDKHLNSQPMADVSEGEHNAAM